MHLYLQPLWLYWSWFHCFYCGLKVWHLKVKIRRQIISKSWNVDLLSQIILLTSNPNVLRIKQAKVIGLMFQDLERRKQRQSGVYAEPGFDRSPEQTNQTPPQQAHPKSPIWSLRTWHKGCFAPSCWGMSQSLILYLCVCVGGWDLTSTKGGDIKILQGSLLLDWLDAVADLTLQHNTSTVST